MFGYSSCSDGESDNHLVFHDEEESPAMMTEDFTTSRMGRGRRGCAQQEDETMITFNNAIHVNPYNAAPQRDCPLAARWVCVGDGDDNALPSKARGAQFQDKIALPSDGPYIVYNGADGSNVVGVASDMSVYDYQAMRTEQAKSEYTRRQQAHYKRQAMRKTRRVAMYGYNYKPAKAKAMYDLPSTDDEAYSSSGEDEQEEDVMEQEEKRVALKKRRLSPSVTAAPAMMDEDKDRKKADQENIDFAKGADYNNLTINVTITADGSVSMKKVSTTPQASPLLRRQFTPERLRSSSPCTPTRRQRVRKPLEYVF